MSDRVVKLEAGKEDEQLDTTLRPKTLKDYVGQEKIKENLKVFMAAAKKRGDPLEHILLYGSPGLGKTTLAHIIAREMGANIRVTSGPALAKAGDLAAILTNLQDHDILFIDEVHRLNKVIEEVLYPAMEDYALDIILGKGPSARTLRLDLPKFTIIGATTKVSLLSAPLRDRFGVTYRLNFYELPDIEKIVDRSAAILNVPIEKPAVAAIAERSRRTPRVANRLLKRVRDFADVKGDGKITEAVAGEAWTMLDVDTYGLDDVDRRILKIIIEKFGGGPVGLNTIAAATAEEMATIEDIYEPFLMQIGFLHRTPRGRVATEHAYRHLGIDPPIDLQQKLL
ncbi:Holliday junction DNA helicase RuvB [Candidatus Uhrbacteria bacterium RIFCSPLOWO2_12_FULL_46_10]|uniref:Holliday junction branch migration complex subunit RuvB n=1 Tax=Candidatus Uhrbacteria bacterium RIFCSPLOWO2_01_FULL_47_25 TaxID=1802402 RepID=A0A1F7UXN0_9BACT|nr:MAG: Holliday junction ATP-dependent DNA helicase RuvB [Parcubacteria group bacterium GW2011_GWA2_46_9]OGL59724.1 MAG: Holliday junction DNA helicase RuvB [Candidatus Uhrbacteria bacterium RIFCSPHIGHO2_01_FULL_46_23]OGL70519.1 MAG: Holliday junction DNA helicase RuvB [Candidatus Uhrbacteria bacterium RIFCSPHIGHO2_02_FULL_47_29]OGL75146.1 MAG: Holliday junction DNA helicase RuvB [Candidatus Uhrbacteria bacterium RIFCSPHIGHO2_12_FULL_46_13]OGL83052.1 MAG: Holliday junction DNA helicase RuvB [C